MGSDGLLGTGLEKWAPRELELSWSCDRIPVLWKRSSECGKFCESLPSFQGCYFSQEGDLLSLGPFPLSGLGRCMGGLQEGHWHWLCASLWADVGYWNLWSGLLLWCNNSRFSSLSLLSGAGPQPTPKWNICLPNMHSCNRPAAGLLHDMPPASSFSREKKRGQELTEGNVQAMI